MAKNSVKVKKGILSSDKTTFTTLEDAFASEAKCGCSIICECNPAIALFDQVTGERVYILVQNGALVVMDKDTYDAL